MHDLMPGTTTGTGAQDPPAERERTLELSFACAPDGQTFISRQRAAYPFHVCRTLRFPGDPHGMATVYVQSSSGGIYEGERLGLGVDVLPDAAAHVTSQASTVVHGMTDGHAVHRSSLRIRAGGMLEFVPDPLILFPGARLYSDVRVVAERNACVILGDSYLHHDPRGKGRTFDRLAGHWEARDEAGALIARDRYEIDGDAVRNVQSGDRPPFAAHGAMVMIADVARSRQTLDDVRDALAADEARHRDAYAGASTLPGGRGIWVRVLAADGASLRRVTTIVWATMRTAMTGEAPQLRRK